MVATSSGDPFRGSRTSRIAPITHCPSHTPHPMHASHRTAARSGRVIASNGHAAAQSPQPMQYSSSTSATKPDDATIGTPCRMASRPPQQQRQQLQIA